MKLRVAHVAGVALLAATVLAPSGCGKPNQAAIQVRKQNQELRDQIAALEQQRSGDTALIRGLQEQRGTLPTLPHERLQRLVTTHDLRLGRLSGGADLDPSKPGDEGLRIYVVPVDEAGDAIKMAGTFTVEATDPSRPADARIGRWTVGLDDVKKSWYGILNRYNYVLTLPWQNPPGGKDLHVSVTFVDELTQSPFTKTIDVTVNPPPAAVAPSTSPSARLR